MKVGYFSDNGRDFVGAVLDNKVFNLSLAASKAGGSVLTDLTALFREERFNVKFFAGLYEQAKGEQQFWHSFEGLTFLPLFRPGKIICLGSTMWNTPVKAMCPFPGSPFTLKKLLAR